MQIELRRIKGALAAILRDGLPRLQHNGRLKVEVVTVPSWMPLAKLLI